MKIKYLLGYLAIVIVIIGVVIFFPHFQNSEDDAGSENSPEYLYSITGEDLKPSLKEPTFVISDNDGKIFVADSGNHRVRVFNSKGSLLHEFGGPGTKKPLLYPYGIGIIGNKVIVADTGAGALYEFTIQGEYVRAWLDTEDNVRPAVIFVSRDREVYVSELTGNQILVFSEGGRLLRKIKPREVSLGAPQGLAVTDKGDVWVADGGNYNVKLLKPNGDLLTVFDGGPQMPLTTAKGLAVDGQGRIYVADTLSNVIRVFNEAGEDLFSFGAGDKKQGLLEFPVGLSFDDQNKIYIADQGNNKIQVWGWKQ